MAAIENQRFSPKSLIPTLRGMVKGKGDRAAHGRKEFSKNPLPTLRQFGIDKNLADRTRKLFSLIAANDVASIARQLSAQPRRPRGFQLLSEEKTDGRWRGGRPKGAKDRQPRRRRTNTA
jgi:hypothetical protein